MKILIIEDDEKLAQMLKIAFKVNGFGVDYCTNGKEGFSKLKSHAKDYALVILDLMLPEMDGIKIAESIKKDKIAVPMIILSARTNDDDIKSALKLGVKDYFVKPFSYNELLTRTREILNLEN
jgi:DNA-binding response OmpR family regulator